MTHEIKGDKLIIEFDIDSTVKSSTGKTLILATSHGYKWEKGIGICYNIVKWNGKKQGA